MYYIYVVAVGIVSYVVATPKYLIHMPTPCAVAQSFFNTYVCRSKFLLKYLYFYKIVNAKFLQSSLSNSQEDEENPFRDKQSVVDKYFWH